MLGPKPHKRSYTRSKSVLRVENEAELDASIALCVFFLAVGHQDCTRDHLNKFILAMLYLLSLQCKTYIVY